MIRFLRYAIAIAALSLSANASARSWSSVYEFWHYSEMPFGVRTYTVANASRLWGTSEPQWWHCGEGARYYRSTLYVQTSYITADITEGFRFSSSCSMDSKYYGDVEMKLELIDITNNYESHMVTLYGWHRLEYSSGGSGVQLTIPYPDWMQPGRYRAKVHTRVVGKTQWRMAHIDFRVR